MNIRPEVKSEPVIARFRALRDAGADLSVPLSSCGDIVIGSVEQNLESEGRFESADSWRGGNNRWEDLADRTKAARAKKGKWPGKKLQVSQGGLAASISKTVSGNEVAVGTNKVYGAIHQFGGQAGRGRKVTIPARPFLVVQEEDIEDMVDVLDKHLAKF